MLKKKKKPSRKVKRNQVVRKPTTRKPTKEEYAKFIQHPKWQKKRLKVFQRDNWRCRKCKDTETTLHVHHLNYTKFYPWNEPMKNLITLCTRCHGKHHKKI